MSLFIYCHSRALRGNPAREMNIILKFLEISEIKDFEDDGVGGAEKLFTDTEITENLIQDFINLYFSGNFAEFPGGKA